MTSSTNSKCPVAFDHTTPEHAVQWPENFQNLREKCPMAWSESYGGFWVATKYADILEISQRDQLFGSGKTVDPETGEIQGGIVIPPNPGPAVVPDESDKPDWERYRGALNRLFSPKAVEAHRPYAEAYAHLLIDRVIESGKIDFVNDLTSPLPAMVTMNLIGFDLDEAEDVANLIHKMVSTPHDDPAFSEVVSGMEQLYGRIEAAIGHVRQHPADNLLTHLVNVEVDGRKFDDMEIRQMIWNIIAGGVDTTTALTANTLLHLYQNPEKRQKLMENRALMPVAREEFVRYFSPIHATSRNAREDTEIGGQAIKMGERVLVAFAAANRDPEIFENPDEIKLERFPNRHIGFGAGIHRCLGSFLARLMFETMLNEVLNRMPDYQIDVAGSRRYTSINPVNGWATMPASFTPGPRLGQLAETMA